MQTAPDGHPWAVPDAVLDAAFAAAPPVAVALACADVADAKPPSVVASPTAAVTVASFLVVNRIGSFSRVSKGPGLAPSWYGSRALLALPLGAAAVRNSPLDRGDPKDARGGLSWFA